MINYKFKAVKIDGFPLDIESGFLVLLSSIETGEYVITIMPRNVELESYKRHFFSQVLKLAKFAGYSTKKDIELFKAQLSDHFKHSIIDIETVEDMKIRMEELHQLASEHYGYYFEPYNPEQHG